MEIMFRTNQQGPLSKECQVSNISKATRRLTQCLWFCFQIRRQGQFVITEKINKVNYAEDIQGITY